MTALPPAIPWLLVGGSLLVALRNLFFSGRVAALRVGRGAMIVCAGLAGYFLWADTAVRKEGIPQYYELPADPPGIHHLMLRRKGSLQGYRVRLVRQPDHAAIGTSAGALGGGCEWGVEGHALRAPSAPGPADPAVIADEDWADPDLVLRYRVTPENHLALRGLALEVTAGPQGRLALAQSERMARGGMMGCLFALLASAIGVASQRRKLARGAARAPAPSTSGPRSPGPPPTS